MITTRHATFAGARTRLLELDGTGPTLIFVHGLTDCADFWLPTMRLLAANGHRAVAVDLPGFAEADSLAAGPVLPQYDRFLDALLADTVARTKQPAIVVGHSLGGCLALRVGHRKPAGLAGIVAAPPVGIGMTWLHRAAGTRFAEWALAGARRLPVRIRHALITAGWKFVALRDRTTAPADFLTAYTGYFDANIAGYASASRRILGELWTAYPQPLAIDRPVLLVWGTRDLLATPASAATILNAVPGSRIEHVEDCGHCPAIEAPVRLAAAVHGFATDLATEERTTA